MTTVASQITSLISIERCVKKVTCRFRILDILGFLKSIVKYRYGDGARGAYLAHGLRGSRSGNCNKYCAKLSVTYALWYSRFSVDCLFAAPMVVGAAVFTASRHI